MVLFSPGIWACTIITFVVTALFWNFLGSYFDAHQFWNDIGNQNKNVFSSHQIVLKSFF